MKTDVPMVSFVGKSGSGKTTLIEKVIPEIVKRGYKVATIKHDTHGFEVDKEGKDTWRHKKAGASTVIISCPWKLAVMKDSDHDYSLDELAEKYIDDSDIIITEGFKKNNKPKIEVSRKETGHPLFCSLDDNLIAIASDYELEGEVKVFHIDDAKGIAGFIIERFLSNGKT